jgi:hypothetical protein
MDKPKRDPVVYFIQSKETGAIKIGTSTAPNSRLSALQSANGHELVLLGTTVAHSEKELHQKFQEFRLKGEWFEPAPALIEFLRGLGLPRKKRTKTDPSLSIQQFCDAEGLSRGLYYKLKEDGKAPRELRVAGIIRITHEARIAWRKKMVRESESA